VQGRGGRGRWKITGLALAVSEANPARLHCGSLVFSLKKQLPIVLSNLWGVLMDRLPYCDGFDRPALFVINRFILNLEILCEILRQSIACKIKRLGKLLGIYLWV
jgi:hypothetical protein